MSKIAKLDAMREWFYNHYEDPAESLPYDSAEGGYIPIYGPLQYTDEILYNQFGGAYPDKLIQELIDEIGDTDIWSPIPDDSWFEPYEESLTSVESAIRDTLNDLASIPKQIEIVRSLPSHSQEFLQMLFVRVYAIIESFLANFITSYIDENFDTLIGAENPNPELQNIKMPMIIAYKSTEMKDPRKHIRDMFRKALFMHYQEKLWHKFGNAQKMYNQFGFLFSYEKTSLETLIEIRHDIVHRDGRTKESLDFRHNITAEMVMVLAEDVREIITSIGEQYHRKNSPQSLQESIINIEL
ncbi:HEPN domain-containing protein [Sulfuricurvum sp.]|uniref:HEPN domain-containing protein n=1 Tax=Sulfuricurvum sp. TaxID=2025608 RepID=UPI002E3391CF|nr:HEPN domain-containing protein [Sulfuricurvum sp.]HEX5330624.1 HEPN domain-containing protein [Sulfuricurvum sp.]